MARRTTTRARRAPTKAITVRTPSPQVKVIRVGERAPARRRGGGSVARRTAGRAAAAVRDEKHTLTSILAGAGLGLAKRQRIRLPHIPQIGTAATYGLGTWVLGRHTRSRTMQHVATGLLTVAAYELAAGSGAADADEAAGWEEVEAW